MPSMRKKRLTNTNTAGVQGHGDMAMHPTGTDFYSVIKP